MTDHDRTVLVTGGTGFLGGWCVAELLRRGHTVRTTVRDLRREPKVRSAVAAAGVEADERRRSTGAGTCCTSRRRSLPRSPRTPTS
ncbi:MAG TPA: NAD-dependent epimerase/dehydratase family protein [Gaiellales bacterium]